MLISSISPKLFPNKRNAPTNEDNKTGSIFESKIRSSKYSPDVREIITPFIDFLILKTSSLLDLLIYFY